MTSIPIAISVLFTLTRRHLDTHEGGEEGQQGDMWSPAPSPLKKAGEEGLSD